MATTDITILAPKPLALSSGLAGSDHHIDWLYLPESFQRNSTDTTVGNLETKMMGWLENLDSSVSFDGAKLAQSIGNKQKRET